MKICLIAALFFLTFSLRADTPTPQPHDVREASRVYAGLLTDKYFGFRPGKGSYVIEAEAADATWFPYFFKQEIDSCFSKPAQLDLSDWQTLIELRKQSSVQRLLPGQIDIPTPYKLVERKRLEAETIEDRVLRAGFEKRYSDANGIISISSVGFNESKDRALVFVSFVSGYLCGGAHYYALEKHRRKWEIIEPAASCAIYS